MPSTTMKVIRGLVGIICGLGLFLCPGTGLHAQSCPRGTVAYQQLIDQVEHASVADRVYRAAAVGASRLVPALRLVSKERTAGNSVAEAAQRTDYFLR